MLDALLTATLDLFTRKACIWLVVTVMALQDDGNVTDMSVLACMAAWKDMRLPQVEEIQLVDRRYFWKDEPSSSLE